MTDHNLELASLILPEIRLPYAAGAQSLDELVATAIRRHADDANDPDLLACVVIEVRQLLASEAAPDPVDVASIDSFPASDPPAWIGRRHVHPAGGDE